MTNAEKCKSYYRALSAEKLRRRHERERKWVHDNLDRYRAGKRALYRKDIEKSRANGRRNQSLTRKRKSLFVIAYKNAHPCADCGGEFPHYVKDFDHVRGEKLFELARGKWRYSFDLLQVEMEKCDVVCANCHRIRTWDRATPVTANT